MGCSENGEEQIIWKERKKRERKGNELQGEAANVLIMRYLFFLLKRYAKYTFLSTRKLHIILVLTTIHTTVAIEIDNRVFMIMVLYSRQKRMHVVLVFPALFYSSVLFLQQVFDLSVFLGKLLPSLCKRSQDHLGTTVHRFTI